jgi:nitrogen fixation protein NifQ
MRVNFPKLFDLNTGDMKWKKFLYKRLCEEEGIYVCRSPSCTECKDHDDCFGPES